MSGSFIKIPNLADLSQYFVVLRKAYRKLFNLLLQLYKTNGFKCFVVLSQQTNQVISPVPCSYLFFLLNAYEGSSYDTLVAHNCNRVQEKPTC